MHLRNRKTNSWLYAAAMVGFTSLHAQSIAYVANASGNNVSVIDTVANKVLASVPVAAGPTGVVVTPNGASVYVASQGANVVVVIDTASNSVVANIPVGATPTQLAINAAGTRVYVADQASNQVSVIDTASKKVIATIGVGVKPAGVAVSPDGSKVFVANILSGNVSVIDTASNVVVNTFNTGAGASSVAVAPNGSRLYVTNQGDGSVSVHTLSGGLLATVNGFSFPNAMAVTPNGARLFVVAANSSTVAAVDTATNTIIGTVKVGSLPSAIAVNSDASRVFVANEFDFSVSVIDTNSLAVSTVPRVGVYPLGIGTIPPQPQQVQAPPAVVCTYSVSPLVIAAYPANGGSGSATVTAPTGCAWTANSNVGWMTVTGGASGSGSGTVTYSVSANSNILPATGALTVAGQSIAVVIAGVTILPDFLLSLPASLQSIIAGGSASYAAAVTPTGGFSAGLAYTVSGLPSGATASVNGNTITVNTSTFTAAGTYSLTITGSGGGITHSVPATLTVSVPVTTLIAAVATAAFVRTDNLTQGSWKGSYGSDGYSVANDSAQLPAYAQVSMSNELYYTWAASTPGDVRGLQKGAGADRIASTWYSPSSFSLDVNLTDGQTHPVAIYALDWNLNSRAQTVDVLNASTGALLDTRSMTGFSNGEYLVWNLSGHVKIRVTVTNGPNAVVGGLFFGATPVTPMLGAATFVKTDSATQGTWKGVYGKDGFSVANDTTALPSYAQVSFATPLSYTWMTSTPGDARALQKAAVPSDRIASTWYAPNGFSMDINFTDSLTHQVAIYALDWNSNGRMETVEVLNASTGELLDTRTLSGFNLGQYLVWNASGHVRIRITSTWGPNAVAAGLFFN